MYMRKYSTYIKSKLMGGICKRKLSFWTLHNTFFHKPIHSFVMISILIFFGYSVKSVSIICSVHFFRVPWIRNISLEFLEIKNYPNKIFLLCMYFNRSDFVNWKLKSSSMLNSSAKKKIQAKHSIYKMGQ